MSNAIKYNRPSGSVIINTEASETEIAVTVQDTGMGIPEDALPHLFEKFYRVREHETKAGGTGLGLSISKQIMQGHNGTLEVKSKVGVGTAFTMRLPRNSMTDPPEINCPTSPPSCQTDVPAFPQTGESSSACRADRYEAIHMLQGH